jgi:DNA repair photolyase
MENKELQMFSNTPDIPQPNEKISAENKTFEGEVNEEKKEQWRKILRELPVSVNNFYGDPVLQWENTIEKLESLEKSHHAGPVGIIMKGKLNDRKVAELKEKKEKGLNLVTLISISELPELEGTGSEHRYENIRMLNEAGVPAIAYIRPMMPPFNTSEEVISKIFSQLKDAGCISAVTSGFRGDESLVERLSPDERVQWAMRVKVMPGEVFERIKKHAEANGIQLYTRTACAVSAAVGSERTYNPYYNSPNLVKCAELNCPMQDTCGPLSEPKEGSLELIKRLGFDVEFISSGTGKACGVSGEDRLRCPSCCTTCYFSSNIPHLVVKGDVNLGDLAFIRFVTGMMAMQPGRNDDGSKEIGKIKFSNYPEIDNAQALNSWWPMSRNIEKCFGCKYCIVSEYYNETGENKDVGFSPSELVDRMFTKNKE